MAWDPTEALIKTLDRSRFRSLALRRVTFLNQKEELELLNEWEALKEGSFWREMEGRVREEEEVAMVEGERAARREEDEEEEEGVRKIRG